MTDDLKFHSAATYSHDETAILSAIKTEEIKPAVKAFLANLHRLKSLHETPAESGFVMGAYSAAIVDAHLGDNTVRDGESKADAVERLFLERIDGKTASDDPDEINFYDRLTNLTGDRLRLGMEAILSAEITGAWTAFEVLAGDLWESALNVHPETLANLNRGRRLDSLTADEKKQMKKIDTAVLGEHHFNIKRKMGTISRGIFKFQLLVGIQDAYGSAFGDGAVLNAVMADPLNTIALLRNVIVHKAGIADGEFLEKTKTNPLFQKTASGKPVSLCGEMVHKVAKPAINATIELIRSVDQWLVDNPQKPEESS